MSWDDIKIGEGETGIITIRVFEIPGDHSISANRVCFRCSDIFYDIGLTIMKDTDEGRKLQEMIDKKQSYNKIKKYLTEIILRKANVNLICLKIEEAMKESFEDGKRSKIKEIRNVLDLY